MNGDNKREAKKTRRRKEQETTGSRLCVELCLPKAFVKYSPLVSVNVTFLEAEVSQMKSS